MEWGMINLWDKLELIDLYLLGFSGLNRRGALVRPKSMCW